MHSAPIVLMIEKAVGDLTNQYPLPHFEVRNVQFSVFCTPMISHSRTRYDVSAFWTMRHKIY